MRFLVAIITLVSLLGVCVQADKDAIGYEMLFFYYVYKMQFVATGTSGMGGTRCHGSHVTIPCGFSDFVKDVMAEDFANAYQPAGTDDTVHPDSSNLNRFEAVADNIPRQYQIGKVLEGETKRVPNAQLIRRVWTIARYARNTGNVVGADMEGAKDAAREALASRFENSKALFNQALQSFLTKAEISYLISDADGWYNWKASLDNIDDAYNKGQISQSTRQQYKNDIKGFSQNLRAHKGAGETASSHISILQEYQKGITSISKWITQNNAAIFDQSMSCKGGITKRGTAAAVMEWLDKGRAMLKRFIGGLPHIGIHATRKILALRVRSEL